MSQSELITRLDAWKQYVWSASADNGAGHKQIVFQFPNGYGASVIPDFSSRNLVELAVLHFRVEGGEETFHIDYDTPITNDVERLTHDELFEMLSAIRDLGEYAVPLSSFIDVTDSSTQL